MVEDKGPPDQSSQDERILEHVEKGVRGSGGVQKLPADMQMMIGPGQEFMTAPQAHLQGSPPAGDQSGGAGEAPTEGE